MTRVINFNLFEIQKINIFLIIFLPISLLAGSLIVNLNVFFIIIFFLVDYKKTNAFAFLKDKNHFLPNTKKNLSITKLILLILGIVDKNLPKMVFIL